MRKFLTFFLTALLAFGVGWAETFTFDCNNGSGLLSQITSLNQVVASGNKVNLTFDKNGGTTPVYNSGSDEVRLYADNTLTIACAAGYTIKSIDFTGTTGSTAQKGGLGNWSADVGEYTITKTTSPAEANWTGDANSVVFTVTSSSGYQVRFKEVIVTIEAPQAAAKSYVRVTDASQLDGKNVILVYENGNSSYAMGAIESSNSRGAGIPIAVTDNRVSITDEAVTEFTFSGTATNCFLAISQGQYLAYSASGKFGTSTTTNNYGKECWKTSAKNGGFYLASVYESGYGIRLYTSSNQFAPFKTGDSYKEAILYVKEEGAAPVTPPSLSANPTSLTIGEGGGSFNVTGDHLIDNVGVELTNGDVFTPTLSSSTNDYRNNENGHWYFIKDNDGELTGTVALAYNGRDLTATSTVTMGTNKPDSDEDEVAQVTVTYQPDIFIYGDFGSGWNYLNDGQMTYADGVYTKTITADRTVFLMFARKTGEGYGWNDNRYFFSAKKTDNWETGNWVFGSDNCNELELSTNGQYHPIQLPEGVYEIKINAGAKTFSITSTSVSNIAQAQAKPVDDTFTFMGSAVVTYQSGNNLWIRDASGSGLINGSVGVTFENGEILAPGWSAKNTMYNGYVPRFTNPANVAKGEGTAAAAPIPLTELTTEDMNKYVSLSNVTVTDVDSRNYTVTIGDKQAHLYDYFQLFTQNPLVEGNKYNVEGVVTYYDGAPELYLTKVEDITPMYVTLESETTTATAGNEIPVTVNVVNAEGDYTISYKIGESGTPTTLTDGDVINVTSETAGEVTLYVTVTSNDNEATAQKTFTFTEPVQPGSNVFKLLTDYSQLQEGKRVIIAGSKLPGDDRSAMGEQQNNNFKSTPVTITNDLTIEATEATQILTLEGETGAWYFKAENNEYLYAASSSDNHLKTQATKTDNAKATIVINSSGGNTQVTFQGDHTHKYLRYNSTNELFSCYLSGKQENIYLYVETASTPEPDPMTISLTAAPEEAYTVGDNVTVTATVEHGSENTVVTYKINNGEEQTYAAPGIVLPNTAAGAIVVTVKATDGNNVATDTVTYHFNAAEAFAITLTATPAQETYEVGSTVNVKVNVENAIGENLTITYTIGETRANETYDPATGINITSATADTVPLTVNVADGYQHAGESTATASYVFVKKTMGLAFDPTSVQVYEGQEVTEPELKNLPEGLTVAYSSSNATVASVDAEGNVTAAAAGEAIITAKFAGNDVYEADSASYTITVLAKKAAGLTYGEEPIVFNVKVGDDIEEPTLANPNRLTVTYESSDTTVAKVDNLGNVSIVGAGTAVITAKSEATTEYLAGEARYTINVTKKNATVTFSEHAYTVYVSNDFTPPTLTTDPVGLDVEYRIEGDVNAVLFDESDGTVVIGDEPGTVTITATFAGNATYNEAHDSYTITVKAKEIATLSFDVEGITVYPNAEDFDQPDLTTTPTGLAVEYTSSDDDIATVVDGELIIGEKTGTATITAKFKGNDTYGEASATYTVTVEPRPIVVADENVEFTLYVGETDSKTIDLAGENLKGNVTLTLNDETGFFTIDPTTIAKADAENATVTVTYAPTTEGIHEATVTISTPDALNDVTVTLTGMATVRPVAAKPTFSPVPGSYTSAQTVTIGCETPGATIRYTVNGETTEATAPVTITLTDDANIEAVAIVNGMTDSEVAAGQYVIDLPTTLPDVTPFKGYYFIKNNGNNQYANIAGRKTLNFTSTPDKMAGTVFWLETNNKGQVQSLRSQGADLQGYADRAMRYVPTMVKMVVDKLHAEGAGTGILGENGYEEIMAKFDSCFDHHLYVEQAEGGWRLYGKTPNMQHVVDFYREHTNQVEAKLPMLEDFINDALTKLRNKMGGQSIFTPFSVHQIWHRMDSALVDASLTEPVDSASTMTFYREVLNNKNYVWSFAYQTAQIYWNNVKNHPRYEELKDKLGEYADYLDEFVNQIRPDFKYYVIQRGNEPDYISEGNKEILDNKPWTIWTLTPREDFTVTVTTENMAGCQTDPKYVTTLYTDFAYTLPTGIKAYKVKDVTKYGNIVTEVINGVIPAQTPVLLMADEAGDYVLTLTTEAGTPVTNNLLVGVDALITRFQLKTPIVVDMFNYAQGFLGDLYDQYVKDYEYLQLLYAGTVNNKYFWGLSNDDVEKCVYINNDGDEDCVIRNLADGKFTNNWKSPETNKAFLMSETFNSIGLYQKGDVNHDGTIDVQDVSMTINYVLGKDNNEEFFCTICADVNNDGIIDVDDVTLIINITLGK